MTTPEALYEELQHNFPVILLPFAVPPVVSSVGLLQLYGSGPIVIIRCHWPLSR